MSTTIMNDNYLATVTASQTNTTIPYTYYIGEDLVFDATHPFFTGSGSLDTNYLYLHPGQTLEGQYHTITFAAGSAPPAGLKGAFRAVGTSNDYIEIQNVKFIVTATVVLDSNGIGAVVVSTCLNGTLSPDYINFTNLIVDQGGITNGQNIIASYSLTAPHVLNFYNIVIFDSSSNPTTRGGLFYNATVSTIVQNYYYVNSTVTTINAPLRIVCSVPPPTATLTNIYTTCPNVLSIPSYMALSDTGGASNSFSNIYMIAGSYSTTTNTNIGVVVLNSNGITLTNYYSNNSDATQFTITFSDLGSSTNIQNQYTSWLSPTLGSGFQASNTLNSPYLLSVFTASPYDGTQYTFFTNEATFLSNPCIEIHALITVFDAVKKEFQKIQLKHLQVGMWVKTLYGNKQVKKTFIFKATAFKTSMYNQIYEYNNTNLILTGGHSILEVNPTKTLENNIFSETDTMVDGYYKELACLHPQCTLIKDGKKRYFMCVMLEDGMRYSMECEGIWVESTEEKYVDSRYPISKIKSVMSEELGKEILVY